MFNPTPDPRNDMSWLEKLNDDQRDVVRYIAETMLRTGRSYDWYTDVNLEKTKI